MRDRSQPGVPLHGPAAPTLFEHRRTFPRRCDSVQLDPGASNLWSDWAESLLFERKFADAIKKCEQSLKVQPPQTRAWLLWGHILEDQGKDAAALAKYKKALDQNPRDPQIKQQVARLEEKLKK